VSGGNFGLFSNLSASGDGYNVNLFATASGSTARNMGVVGAASGTSVENIGIYGRGSGGTTNIGVMASLYTATDALGALTSAALIADNALVAAPIFLGRDSGSTVFTIADGGEVTAAPVSGHTGHAFTVTGGALATTKRSLSVTGTLPNTAAGDEQGIVLSTSTSAGTGPSILSSLVVGLGGSTTIAGLTRGLAVNNQVLGTGTAAITLGGANYAILAQTGDFGGSTGAGHRVGVYGLGRLSTSRNFGMIGAANETASTDSVGVYGTTASATNNIGGMFTLYGATDSIGTLTSTALLADNGATTSPIFLGRDNGTTVFTIADAGIVSASPGTLSSSASTTALSVTATAPDAAFTYRAGFFTLNTTGATNAATGLQALGSNLAAGYTGTRQTTGFKATNNVAGTGTQPLQSGTGPTNDANYGIFGQAGATTAGHNVGVTGWALNGARNYGVVGRGRSGTDAIGVMGVGNFGTNNIGGWFHLYGDTDSVGTATSAALIVDNSSQTSPIALFRDNGTNVVTIADSGEVTVAPVSGHSSSAVTVTGGTLASGQSGLKVTATNSSSSGVQAGVNFTVASAGVSPSHTAALLSFLTSGYTGTGLTASLYFDNATAGAGATPLSTGNANYGVYGNVQGSTAGHNVAIHGVAFGSTTRNYGGSFRAAGAGTDSIGVYAQAEAGTNRIGGMFTLISATDSLALTSAALIADNGSQASPIFLGRDNTTTVFTIADGGDTTIAPVSGHTGSVLTLTGGTLASTTNLLSGSATLPNVAAAQAGFNFQVSTSAGTSPTALRGGLVQLLAGSTTASVSLGLQGTNAVATTGTTPISASTGNYGVRGDASSVGGGHNVGVYGSTSGSTARNIAVLGRNTGAGTDSIGVLGFTTTGGTKSIGVMGALNSSATDTFTLTSSAALFSNGDAAANILTLLDNTTTVVTVADGGQTTIQPVTAAAALNTGLLVLAQTAATGTTPLGTFGGGDAAYGIRAYTQHSATANHSIGGLFSSNGSTVRSIGVAGVANSGSTVGIGSYGTSVSATSANIGGMFTLYGQTDSIGTLTTSTALLVDNATVAAPVAIFRDNGTAVVTIADGGITTFAQAIEGQSYFRLLTSSPTVYLHDTSAGADAKVWRYHASGGTLSYLVHNDAYTVSNTYMNVARSGTTITSLSFLTGATSAVERLRVGNVASDHAVSITGGTLATTLKRALDITGTLPDIVGDQRGVDINIVSGSGATNTSGARGMFVGLSAGATAATTTVGIQTNNTTVGVGAAPLTSSQGNFGVFAITQSDSAAHNVGVFSRGEGSSTFNWGGIFAAGQSATTDGTHSIGLYGTAQDGTSVNIGVAATLYGKTDSYGTLASAALYVDNAGIASPIFLGRDNGTTVFTIADGGDTTVAPVSGHTGNALTITGGTLASTLNALNVTGTLPNVAADQRGIDVVVSTTAGTAPTVVRGMLIQLQANYTGTAVTQGFAAANNVAGQGTTPIAGTSGNWAVTGSSVTSTAGHNVGVYGIARAGVNNYALLGRTNTSGTNNLGCYATGSGGSSVNIGGAFTLYGDTDSIGTLTSAALYADNAGIAAPIFLGRDNGTTVFAIADGGQVQAIDGTTSVPAYSFISDTNSGITGGSDVVGIVTGGTERVQVGSTTTIVKNNFRVANQSFEEVQQGVVSTSDATTTTLWSLATDNNTSYYIEADIIARQSTGETNIYKIAWRGNNTSSSIASQATITIMTSEEVSTWDATIDTSSTTVRVRVTGAAATSINWATTVRIRTVT
jgi:hypothetical protein